MRLLDRYLGLLVFRGTLLALAVLMALFAFINFVDDLGDVGKGNYTLLRAVEYMILTLPRLCFSLFPLAALLGSLLALGSLASNFELTVVRAAGVSVGRISFAVMKTAVLLVVISVFVGEILTPISERFAQHRRSIALTQQIGVGTSYGFWIRDGQSYINIRKVFPSNRIEDVYIYEFDDERLLRVSTYAKEAVYDEEQGKWLLTDIEQSELQRDRVTARASRKAVWDSPFAPDIVNVAAVRPESLSSYGLYRYLGYLRDNGLSTTRYELALWGKLVYPFATAVMIFLGIPLVLGRLHSVGVGTRILVGALVGIAFHIVQQTSVHVGVVYEVPPVLSATVPTLAFLGFGIWLMRRLH